MTKVAARFQISDVAVKKRCTKHRIPVPGRGYWRQLETGKKPKRIPLPKMAEATRIVFHITPKPAKEPPVSTVDQASAAYEQDHPILVGEIPQRPHAATKAVARDLKGQKPDDYGAIRTKGTDAFQIRIHPSSMDRIVRLIEALALACIDRGFELREGKAGDHYRHHLSVAVGGEAFVIGFDERMRRVPYRMSEAELARKRRGDYVYTPTYAYEPTGELTLKIEGGYGSSQQTSWRDTKRVTLETRLNEVMLSLRGLAAYKVEERRKADEKKRRYDVIQQERAELRQRVANERKAVETLDADAAAWERAEKLRAYIAAVERQCIADGTLAERAGWLDWARRQADRIDPTMASPPSILDTPEADYRPFELWQMRDD